MRYNWNPIEKCAVQLESYSSIQIRQRRTRARESQSKSAGAGRDGPNIRYCVPLKIPNIRYCVPTEIPENPQSNAVPAGPPPAGKTPKPNRLVFRVVAVVAVVVVATRESRLCRQKNANFARFLGETMSTTIKCKGRLLCLFSALLQTSRVSAYSSWKGFSIRYLERTSRQIEGHAVNESL